MADMRLDIASDGTIRVSVGGVVIEQIEELEFTYKKGKRPVMRVKLPSVKGMPPDEARARLVEMLHFFYDALHSCPWVEVYDQSDTLPSMPAVKPPKGT